MRLIDSDAANVDSISCYYGDRAYLDDVQEWLDEQPTVDTVVHGKWIPVPPDSGLKKGHMVCSVCGMAQPCWYDVGQLFFWKCNYCPSCGAKMDLEE